MATNPSMMSHLAYRVFVLTFSVCGCFSKIYHEVEDIEGKQYVFDYIRRATANLEDCAALCFATMPCDSFLHDKNSNCHLIAAHSSIGQTTGSFSATTQYYITGSSLDAISSCPEGFDNASIPNVCFKRIDSLTVDSETASSICRSYTSVNLVGHLLTVNSLDMFNQLSSILSSGNYHFDGYKRLPDGAWVDWKGNELALIQWDGGEPDNRHRLDPTTEQCVFLRSYAKAHDISCQKDYGRLLCQLVLSTLA